MRLPATCKKMSMFLSNTILCEYERLKESVDLLQCQLRQRPGKKNLDYFSVNSHLNVVCIIDKPTVSFLSTNTWLDIWLMPFPFCQFHAPETGASKIWQPFSVPTLSSLALQKDDITRWAWTESSQDRGASWNSPSECSQALRQAHSVWGWSNKGTPQNSDWWAQLLCRIFRCWNRDKNYKLAIADNNGREYGIYSSSAMTVHDKKRTWKNWEEKKRCWKSRLDMNRKWIGGRYG